MANVVTGTFSDTGNSSSLTAKAIAIDATFAGTATINVQWLVDGANWRTIESFTTSFQRVFEGPRVPVRLNCSAHTDNVTYAMIQTD